MLNLNTSVSTYVISKKCTQSPCFNTQHFVWYNILCMLLMNVTDNTHYQFTGIIIIRQVTYLLYTNKLMLCKPGTVQIFYVRVNQQLCLSYEIVFHNSLIFHNYIITVCCYALLRKHTSNKPP